MGCCAGSLRNLNLRNEVFVYPQKLDKKQELDIISPAISSQNIKKLEKEEFKKEKSTNECQNLQKTEKIDTKIGQATQNNISPQTYNTNEENIIKINKKKVIKKGSQRVQNAMKELKLISLKELDNNKNFFS